MENDLLQDRTIRAPIQLQCHRILKLIQQRASKLSENARHCQCMRVFAIDKLRDR